MDIVGPLPRTQRGNLYILTVDDHFAKHVKVYALPDQEAVTIARVFLNEFTSWFRCPIHHPHGPTRQLRVAHVQGAISIIEHQENAHIALPPQCDGQV